MITIVDDLFDLNLNQALRTLELLNGTWTIQLSLVLGCPVTKELTSNDDVVRTFIKLIINDVNLHNTISKKMM
jgi:hypothetical protein